MHLEKDNLELDHLQLQNRGEVYSANSLIWLSGIEIPEGASVTSWPFTTGGAFPKALSASDTNECVKSLAILTDQTIDTIKSELSGAEATNFNTSVHDVIAEAFISRTTTK